MQRRHLRLYDRAFGADPATWRQLSPLHQLNAQAVPVLAVCSTQRRDQPCTQAQEYTARALALGVAGQVLPQDLDHGEVNKELGVKENYTRAVDRVHLQPRGRARKIRRKGLKRLQFALSRAASRSRRMNAQAVPVVTPESILAELQQARAGRAARAGRRLRPRLPRARAGRRAGAARPGRVGGDPAFEPRVRAAARSPAAPACGCSTPARMPASAPVPPSCRSSTTTCPSWSTRSAWRWPRMDCPRTASCTRCSRSRAMPAASWLRSAAASPSR